MKVIFTCTGLQVWDIIEQEHEDEFTLRGKCCREIESYPCSFYQDKCDIFIIMEVFR